MKTLMDRARPARFLCVFVAAILLPVSVAAQPQLVVNPTTPINVQASAGTNAPSQTVQISNGGNRALKWSVQESASWLSVSPASGVNNGTVTLAFQTSGLAPGQYPTTVSVTSNGGSRDIPVQVTINTGAPPPPPTLTVTCPANMSVTSSNGSPVVVNYTVTTTGGAPPVTVTGTPASGSSFPVATTTVQVNAKSNDGQTASCSFTVTVTSTAPPPPGVDISASPTNPAAGSSVTVSFSGVANPTPTDWMALASAGSSLQTYQDWKYASSCTGTPGTARASGSCPFTAPTTGGSYEFRLLANDGYTLLDSVTVTVAGSPPPPPPPPPPPSSGLGPQSTITCPGDAINIFPGTPIPNIQDLINASAGATTFCFKAGVHSVDRSIIPKTGNTFVGEYGAILDGTGWTTFDDSEGAFRAHNQDIDYVTIRNLVIRNLRRGINGFGTMADHWTIEYNDIGPNWSGIVFPSYTIVRNNYIHDNSYSGYLVTHAHHSTFENNEIARNGWEQKVTLSTNVTFRNNFIHHNSGGGIWYDTDNTGALVEGNRIEDNGWIGIFYEISGDGIIRNNTIRRNAEAGVFVGTSKNTQIYNNTIEHNFRGITYFLNCPAVGGGAMFYDLTNVTSHHNTITVGTQSGALASVFTYYGSCPAAQVAPYKNGSMNLTFSDNSYDVPSPSTGQYWYWDGFMTWSLWRALGQDTTSTVQ